MTDDWDFYFCHVEDKAASIYVDLGAIDMTPVSNLPFMACVRLRMNAPRDDGLSSNEEFDVLVAIEDALMRELVVDNGTAYVGRCTTDSCRDFFFYVAQPQDWAQRVAKCMRSFSAYKYEAETKEEKDWSTYRSYLYPTDADLQTIGNRRVCEALERNGDKLSAPREIDHWAYFSDARSRDGFVAEAIQLGYGVRVVAEPDEDEARYSAQVWRNDVPSYRAIDGLTLQLFDLAVSYDGKYDGWESALVTQDNT